MTIASKPRIGITLGDPCGIGPEIALKAATAREVTAVAEPVLIGSRALFEWACRADRAGADRLRALAGNVRDAVTANASALAQGRACAEGGRVSFEAVRAGVRMIERGEIDAIATAPISKEAWRLAGFDYPGHTELLAELGRAPSYGMLFVAGELRVLLATIHVPLARVPSLITIEGLVEKITLLATTLTERFGIAAPRIGVAGVNPHAGEGGLFGDEEERAVRPAIERARALGIDAVGPIPGDVLFGEVYRRDGFSAAVAMYHDQGLIPVKQAAFGSAVNTTIGLPFIRTSPDHGTAFDIAGKGVARESSMVAAVLLAAQLAARKGSGARA
jgi:4-hydroxythreonine-4-phosphate dehydrogenase